MFVYTKQTLCVKNIRAHGFLVCFFFLLYTKNFIMIISLFYDWCLLHLREFHQLFQHISRKLHHNFVYHPKQQFRSKLIWTKAKVWLPQIFPIVTTLWRDFIKFHWLDWMRLYLPTVFTPSLKCHDVMSPKYEMVQLQFIIHI